MLFFKSLKLAFAFYLVTSFDALSAQEYEYKLSKHDFPTPLDLEKYVTVLKNITAFYLENLNDITISVAFGIFIGNVHLGRAFKHKNVHGKDDLLDVYMKSEEVLKYYLWRITQEESGRDCLQISQLFTNVSTWVDRVEDFKPPVVSYTISGDFQRNLSWGRYAYVANVRRADQWTPSPKESDYCLKLLAGSENSINDECSLDDRCYEIVSSGSDIGYALCHRALLLLVARNSVACTIISPREDSALLDTFCSMSYAEAEYITYNDYGLVDLLLEHISLCALHGRSEFLQREWLENILEFQTAYGCFSQVSRTVEEDNNDLLDGRCSGHTTALATSVVAAAVRFILEQY